MTKAFDAIVVGARCAGSPTAMLLARAGYRVLVVDHATFPSDTLSTHILHPLGAATLSKWGLLDRLAATACPPIHTYAFDFGSFSHFAKSAALAQIEVLQQLGKKSIALRCTNGMANAQSEFCRHFFPIVQAKLVRPENHGRSKRRS